MSKFRSYRAEGIVLRRKDYGEADRLLTLYTQEEGKIRALAKGARKPQSRKTGHVELFMCSNFQLGIGKAYDIITQAELIDPHRQLSTDLLRTTYAAYIVELLDHFTMEGEKNLPIYHLLKSTLTYLTEQDNLRLIARHYELRLLSLTGFQPQFFFCVVSGDQIQQVDQFFSAEEGGLIAPDYRNQVRGVEPISASAVKVLRFLQTRPWEVVQDLRLRPELHQEIERILRIYLQYHLEKRVKSADFLYRLRREASLFESDSLE